MESKYKILMADDEENILKLAGGALEELGYEVFTANNGAAAFEKALIEKPDLIILDRNMPVMEGTEVCRKLKDNEEMKNVPVIFLTARDEEKEMIEGLKLGACDYLTKPFSLAELKTRVENILAKEHPAEEDEIRH
jgi:two-component system alkaline phosphatase synthesis response regulator PhoP